MTKKSPRKINTSARKPAAIKKTTARKKTPAKNTTARNKPAAQKTSARTTKKTRAQASVNVYNLEAEDLRRRNLRGTGGGLVSGGDEGTRGIGEGKKRYHGHAREKGKDAYARHKTVSPRSLRIRTNSPRGKP